MVRPGELGTVAEIRAAAAERGMDVLSVTLDDQFHGNPLAVVPQHANEQPDVSLLERHHEACRQPGWCL